MTPPPKSKIVVIVSANAEWQAIRSIFADADIHASPLGEWFATDLQIGTARSSVVLFHGGWGKIAAAGSAQYIVDRCQPSLIVNLGTCGGFEGEIERGTIILVDRVIVYDIFEQMGDHDEHIAHYTTAIDLAWLKEPYPHSVLRTLLVSGDRDLIAEEIPTLKTTYGAVAGDWESGSIAWVANRNGTSCLILRGVTDLVGPTGGDAYGGNIHVFEENTMAVMERLVRYLPAWIERFEKANPALQNTETTGLLVRSYQEEDEVEVIGLWGTVFPNPPSWNVPAEDIRRKLSVQRELFLVGVINGRVVGAVMAGFDGHRGWLHLVAVHPDNQRQGIGRAMMQEAERRLRELGCSKVNLQVRATNSGAVAFYESIGYMVEDRISMGKRLEQVVHSTEEQSQSPAKMRNC